MGKDGLLLSMVALSRCKAKNYLKALSWILLPVSKAAGKGDFPLQSGDIKKLPFLTWYLSGRHSVMLPLSSFSFFLMLLPKLSERSTRTLQERCCADVQAVTPLPQPAQLPRLSVRVPRPWFKKKKLWKKKKRIWHLGIKVLGNDLLGLAVPGHAAHPPVLYNNISKTCLPSTARCPGMRLQQARVQQLHPRETPQQGFVSSHPRQISQVLNLKDIEVTFFGTLSRTLFNVKLSFGKVDLKKKIRCPSISPIFDINIWSISLPTEF